MVYLLFRKILNLSWKISYAIGQFFIFSWPNVEKVIHSSGHTARNVKSTQLGTDVPY